MNTGMKTTTCLHPEPNSGTSVLDSNLHTHTQSRCYVMLRSGENDLEFALSSHQLRTGTKLLNERQGDQAVSSELGVDEAACSPCPTLHLGPFKAFLIA